METPGSNPVPTGSAGGLAGNNVLSLLEDRSIGSGSERTRREPSDRAGWTGFTSTDGLAPGAINCMPGSRDGSLWFGSMVGEGVSHYDGTDWRDVPQWTTALLTTTSTA